MSGFKKFEENKGLICKMDLESLMISNLLVKYKNCKIVGFFSDAHIITIEDKINLNDVLFINETVLKPEYHSLSTTISSFNLNHSIDLIDKYDIRNPNVFTVKHINSQAIYSVKFPFSSLLLTIAILEGDGIDLSNDINFKSEVFIGKLGLKWFTTANFILMFNDMFSKNEKNKDNIKMWYSWVENMFYGGNLTEKHLFYNLMEYLNNEENILFWTEQKNKKLMTYLSETLVIDKYLSFDLEQLAETDIVNDCLNYSNECLFGKGVAPESTYVVPSNIYKLDTYYGEPNLKATHDIFFFKFLSKDKVKYSYNIEKLM